MKYNAYACIGGLRIWEWIVAVQRQNNCLPMRIVVVTRSSTLATGVDCRSRIARIMTGRGICSRWATVFGQLDHDLNERDDNVRSENHRKIIQMLTRTVQLDLDLGVGTN